MWFLFALFYDYILYAIVDRLNLHKFAYACIPALVVFYICLAQGAYIAGVAVPNIIYRNFLIEGFCFFMLGNWIHCNQNKIRISNSSLVVIIFICTLLCFVERAFFPWQNPFYPADRRADEATPWLEAFVNARKWVEAHKK